ncbi:MAG: hypothetical protein R8J94_09585 [Acidimicrobiia bacterium]|nr:hypothetical protein [Acidimicrobiia bacterium]
MNLEDRLRSHMHSGDDLFVESRQDVGAITSAGRRRTRRNQVGGAAVGGVLALGLVFGIASQTDGNEPEEFADSAIESAEAEMATSAVEDSVLPDGPVDEDPPSPQECIDCEPVPPRFIEYEAIVGVEDGFAGLRATEDGIVAITSEDGIRWLPLGTSGIPAGAEITGIVHDDGVFAAPFVVYDEQSAASMSYIGTSTDLVNWTVEQVDLGDDFSDPFLDVVVLSDGEVIAVVMVWPPFDDASEELVILPDPSIFTIRGPVGGPYSATPLSTTGFGVGGLTAADGVVMFIVSTEDGADIWASDGGEWTLVRQSPPEEFPTLGGEGENMYLVDSGGVERSDDAGVSWIELDIDASILDSYSSAIVVSSDDTLAVLFSLVSDDGRNGGHVLVAGADDALEEVALEGFVPGPAFVNLVAVNAEEALIEVFPQPENFDEELAASSGVVEEPEILPRYVRVPLS